MREAKPSLACSRVILIYKTYMHTESTLDPERCSFKSDAGTRSKWITKQIQQVDEHEDCVSPPLPTVVDEDMEEDAQHETEQEHAKQDGRGAADGTTDGATCGSGQHHTETMQDYIKRAAKMPIRQIQREELGTPHLHNTNQGQQQATSGGNNSHEVEKHLCPTRATRKWDRGERQRKAEL